MIDVVHLWFYEHWSCFIVENDFKFMASNGLNAVRIPVGWWIASDPVPPSPYVGGSLHALDNAFLWAHTRFSKWLSAWYAKSPSLYATELLNESLSPSVILEMLNKYYKGGYEAVRRHCLRFM
ncbi:hypothetical protein VNO78_30994 [Psophocarpus tetragonolobus]|uniref:Glucan 1,3-beta-glucosidase n=1 Tax=Psophocarpus tetragonolobus TaxID=3891 RepID=A0AAN9RXL8_PSOTE